MHDSFVSLPDHGRLLQQMRDQVGCIQSMPEVLDDDYMHCHTAFEKASDQQGQILDWLVDRLTAGGRSSLSILSVGAGSGILDIPLIASIARKTDLRYFVIEPIEEQCRRFGAMFYASQLEAKVDLRIINATLEDADIRSQFDYVLAIHSGYYMPNLGRSIGRMMDVRRPGGKLVLAVAPLEEMNLLADLFWSRQCSHRIWFAKDVEECLVQRGEDATRTRLSGTLRFAPSDSQVIDFLIQTQGNKLPQDTYALVTQYLKSVSTSPATNLEIPHPVTLFEVS